MTRILIVDDHPLYSNGLSALLQSHFADAHILQAGGASEANAMVSQHHPIHWVFLDCFLQDCNGIELLKELRKTLAGADIVLTSASDRVDLVCEALDRGAQGFLSKTESPAGVFDCLHKIAAGEIYLSAHMQRQLRHYRTVVYVKNRITRQISKRQQEVLLLLSAGYSNAEIAKALGISPHTVKDHVSNIMQLLDADNRVHCITEARQLGLIV